MSRSWDAVGACYVELLRAVGLRKPADLQDAERDDPVPVRECSRCRRRFLSYPAGARVADRLLCRACNRSRSPLAGIVSFPRRK